MTGTAQPRAAADAVTRAEAARFAAALARLSPGGRLGLAVSGGPDSLGMLLLAQAAAPGQFEAATVDHGLRPEAAGEARMVADLCAAYGVRHAVLRVAVGQGNLHDEARRQRYAALAQWAQERGLGTIATAHHSDDQAETMLMRLNRGSGLAGLSAIREAGHVPGASALALVRPVLAWRRAELAAIVERAGIDPVLDPTNADPKFDRARLRAGLAGADWLDPAAIAQSAAHLADAEAALDWAANREWDSQVDARGETVRYTPRGPRALVMRVAERIIGQFGGTPRGGATARLVDALADGQPATLAGVTARPHDGAWLFRAETGRRG